MKATWSVIAVFEDTTTREPAVNFCAQLVDKFWRDVEFNVTWLSFEQLEDAQFASQAARKAEQAELIVFSVKPGGPLPFHVRNWVENWLAGRNDREGALAGLGDPGDVSAQKHVYLRNVAHRGGMDYLTDVPHALAHPIPDSLESYAERAGQVTSVLHNILHQPAARPRLQAK